MRKFTGFHCSFLPQSDKLYSVNLPFSATVDRVDNLAVQKRTRSVSEQGRGGDGLGRGGGGRRRGHG